MGPQLSIALSQLQRTSHCSLLPDENKDSQRCNNDMDTLWKNLRLVHLKNNPVENDKMTLHPPSFLGSMLIFPVF